jgi:organic radical activating enzyme
MSQLDFNPMKILAYNRFLDIFVGRIPNPIMLEIDPCGFCNFGCKFCSSRYQLKQADKKYIIDPKRFEYIMEFINSKKCVEGIYWCGGGEPTLNKHLEDYSTKIKNLGIKNYITTNGSTLEKNYKYLIDNFEWIAISVNAGSKSLWKKVSNSKLDWQNYLDGIEKLAEYNTVPWRKGKIKEVTYKYTFTPNSWQDIIGAYQLAIILGCTNFIVKPADMFIYDRGKENNFYKIWKHEIIEKINNQIDCIKAMNKTNPEKIKLNCGSFYGGFDMDRNKRFPYNKCWTNALCPVFGADGFIHLCCVRRSEKNICRWDDGKLLDFWGSEEHKKLLDFNPKNECPARCKLAGYNELFQQMYIDKNFSWGSI